MSINIQNSITHRVRLTKKVSVEFKLDSEKIVVEWYPDIPKPMTNRIFKRYQAARNDFMQIIAQQIKEPVVCVNLEGNVVISNPQEVH